MQRSPDIMLQDKDSVIVTKLEWHIVFLIYLVEYFRITLNILQKKKKKKEQAESLIEVSMTWISNFICKILPIWHNCDASLLALVLSVSCFLASFFTFLFTMEDFSTNLDEIGCNVLLVQNYLSW